MVGVPPGAPIGGVIGVPGNPTGGRTGARPAEYRRQGRDHDSSPLRKTRLLVLRAAQKRRRQEQGRGSRALVREVEEFASAEFALEQAVLEGRHRDPALDDLAVESPGGG